MPKIDLYNGDCLIIMDELIKRGIMVDMVLTDIPYGKTACKWDNVIPFDIMWGRLHKLVKLGGNILLFGTEPFSTYLRMSNIKEYRYDLIWHKTTSSSLALAQKRPMSYHENISVFYDKFLCYNPQFQEYSISTKHRYKDGEKIKRTPKVTNQIQEMLTDKQGLVNYGRGKYCETILNFQSVGNGGGKKLHPSQKPIALLEWLIKGYSNKNDVVLDFTMGSGSTGVACINTNRNFIGIELDKKYFEIAKSRIEECQQKSIS